MHGKGMIGLTTTTRRIKEFYTKLHGIAMDANTLVTTRCAEKCIRPDHQKVVEKNRMSSKPDGT